MIVPKSCIKMLKALLERETGLPVLGYLPHLPDAALESRHLGLKTAGEIADLQQKISRMADALVVDWEKLSILTEGAAPLVHTDRLLLRESCRPREQRNSAPAFPLPLQGMRRFASPTPKRWKRWSGRGRSSAGSAPCRTPPCRSRSAGSICPAATRSCTPKL